MFKEKCKHILHPLLDIEFIVNKQVYINEDEGFEVVVNVDDIVLATKESIKKHYRQVRKCFELLQPNSMSLEID